MRKFLTGAIALAAIVCAVGLLPSVASACEGRPAQWVIDVTRSSGKSVEACEGDRIVLDQFHKFNEVWQLSTLSGDSARLVCTTSPYPEIMFFQFTAENAGTTTITMTRKSAGEADKTFSVEIKVGKRTAEFREPPRPLRPPMTGDDAGGPIRCY